MKVRSLFHAGLSPPPWASPSSLSVSWVNIIWIDCTTSPACHIPHSPPSDRFNPQGKGSWASVQSPSHHTASIQLSYVFPTKLESWTREPNMISGVLQLFAILAYTILSCPILCLSYPILSLSALSADVKGWNVKVTVNNLLLLPLLLIPPISTQTSIL